MASRLRGRRDEGLSGQLTPEQARLKQLERENADLRMERDILKKAIGIFTSRRG